MYIKSALFVAVSLGFLVGGTTANAADCHAVYAEGTTFANSFTCGPVGDLITTTGPGSGFTILDEGSGWHGEFSRGSQILYDNGVPGAVVSQVQYPFPAYDLGFSIQANAIGPYVATLTAYLGGSLVGVATYSGDNELGPEGTIPHFDVSAFAYSPIDSWTLSTTNDADGFGYYYGVSVPEPASWTLMLVGFGGLGVVMRRKAAMAAAAAVSG
jgi:hypothetical protein